MIIMINGAFGSGKTSAAKMLQPFIPNSMIFDPEEIGYMVRKIAPEEIRLEEEQTDDFQDIELWRILTVNAAREVKQKYNKHLIVPMTIYKSINFDYIYNGFQEIDKDLFHFCLVASEETIQQRLTARGDTIGGWTFQQIQKCVDALNDRRFDDHIYTDHLDTAEVIKLILNKITDR
ncbi:chloramphenicol 3-O-phosphotransferase [Paenibacillus sp. DS2015]|uniref:AAA family ATPase n=1 Tax=Paenibacillus sp. DS2015 TaxID=3373917 RepID=UPI003D1C0119